MIVRPAASGVHLITQPDHARLARAIMERSVALDDHPRRDVILHAIAEHDNGWQEEDVAPTVNPAAGDVADFITLPLDARQAVWPRGVGRLANHWAAALVANHAVTVYDRFRGDGRWASFFVQMETMRDDRLRASGLSFDDLLADYPFVRLGDLMSLAFCTGSTDRQRYGAWTISLAGSRVVVTPDPFAGASIAIEIAARELPHRAFATDAELRDTLRGASTVMVRGHVAGSST